jgi:hypothetical protein
MPINQNSFSWSGDQVNNAPYINRQTEKQSKKA